MPHTAYELGKILEKTFEEEYEHSPYLKQALATSGVKIEYPNKHNDHPYCLYCFSGLHKSDRICAQCGAPTGREVTELIEKMQKPEPKKELTRFFDKYIDLYELYRVESKCPMKLNLCLDSNGSGKVYTFEKAGG